MQPALTRRKSPDRRTINGQAHSPTEAAPRHLRRGGAARRRRRADPARQGDRLGAQVLDLPVPLRDRVLRDGVHVALDGALRHRPLRRAPAAFLAAPGRSHDGDRHGDDAAGADSQARLRADGRAQVGDGVRRLRLDGRFLRQLHDACGHRPDHPRRHLRPRLPAAARGRARRAHGAAAEDPALEADARPRSDGRAVVPEHLLLRCRDIPDLRQLDVYIQHGGYEATRKALTTSTPERLVEMVKASNLRGRGGAGFPTGMKWSFLPKQTEKPVYLAVNADESEPGTFKDRELIEDDPHQLLEGIIITSYAIRCHTAYIYIRGEFAHGARVLEDAIAEARARGFLGKNLLGTGFDLDVWVHRGAGAYICGEETGLIESLEGKRGYPRIKPPFPATHGLFGCPTIVNNVETLACVPHIVLRGADWFRAIGPEKSPGPKLFCVSGHVVRPGTYELPMGTPLREIIYDHAGGIPGDRKLKGVIPGGASMPVFTADEIDVPMDMDSVQKAGSFLGSAGIMVMDETVCMVWTALVIARFFHHESCGQCTPCREGTGWLDKVLRRLEYGEGTATAADVDLLLNIAGNMMGTTICALSDAAAMPARAFVTKYRAEFEEHAALGRCPFRPIAEPSRRHAHA